MKQQPILIQGAEESEICVLLSQLEQTKAWNNGGYLFWSGTYRGVALAVCQTEIGLVNAACATTLAILRLNPRLVLNQGTAGAHVEKLHVGDVVVGESSVNLNNLIMPPRALGKGSSPFDWSFSSRAEVLAADSGWVSRFAAAPYRAGQKVVGRLGSGDLFSREADRIRWLQAQRGELCEDMESIAVYEVCHRLSVPCLGLRIISNNELTGEPYRESIASELQLFLLDSIARLERHETP